VLYVIAVHKKRGHRPDVVASPRTIVLWSLDCHTIHPSLQVAFILQLIIMSGHSTQCTKATKEVDTDPGSDSDDSAEHRYEELSISDHSKALSGLCQQKWNLDQEIQQAYLSLEKDEDVCQQLTVLGLKQATLSRAIKKHERGLQSCFDHLNRRNASRMNLEKPKGPQALGCAEGPAYKVGDHNQDEK
jgi:hypothetical protein